MGYTKKWTPPTIPLRDDLAAWKILFNDVHNNLISAGLVQTATAGQLDISTVSSLPADGAFAGFIEYAFDDALQSEAPVIIKLSYGCGAEGLGSVQTFYIRTRTPRIKVEVYFKGGLIGAFQCPQAHNASGDSNSQLVSAGASYICYNKENGFLGVCYGADSRNKPFANSQGGYYGATLTFFIQRVLGEVGEPTSVGLAMYNPNLPVSNTSNLWTSGVLGLSYSTFSNGAPPITRTDMAPRVGRDGFAGGVDSVLLEPIYFPTNPPTPFPYLYSYRNTAILAGTEFEFNSVVGAPLNFIAIGNETCMSIDSVDGHRAGIAMLFE